jgi:hypothetical protein
VRSKIYFEIEMVNLKSKKAQLLGFFALKNQNAERAVSRLSETVIIF